MPIFIYFFSSLAGSCNCLVQEESRLWMWTQQLYRGVKGSAAVRPYATLTRVISCRRYLWDPIPIVTLSDNRVGRSDCDCPLARVSKGIWILGWASLVPGWPSEFSSFVRKDVSDVSFHQTLYEFVNEKKKSLILICIHLKFSHSC